MSRPSLRRILSHVIRSPKVDYRTLSESYPLLAIGFAAGRRDRLSRSNHQYLNYLLIDVPAKRPSPRDTSYCDQFGCPFSDLPHAL